MAVAAAAPSERDAKADTLRSDSAVNPDSFQYSYETSNGIKAQEAGQLKQIDKETAIVTHGDFSYQSPEGDTIQLSYTADENGYRPTVSSPNFQILNFYSFRILSVELYSEFELFYRVTICLYLQHQNQSQITSNVHWITMLSTHIKKYKLHIHNF